MLIICEGVDCSGKTTLVDELKRHLPKARVLHRGPPKADPLEEYELDLQAYRPGTGQDVICDRWVWGELIYGPLYRGASKLEGVGVWHVEAFLRARGAVMVHLDLPLAEVQRRLARRGEAYLQPEHVDLVRQRYQEVARASQLRVLTLTAPPTAADVQAILAAGSARERATAPLAAFSTYVGARHPTMLLLGEQRNTRKAHYTSAFPPYGGSSGRYLLEALEPHRRALTSGLGLANALEEDVPALLATLHHPPVATLGALAHQHLDRLHMPHGAVPHPQFVRRFLNGHQRAYATQVIAAATHQEDRLAWRP